MKKVLKLFVVSLLVLTLFSGCSKKSDHIIELSLDEFKEKINNKDTFALYIGNDDCSHCVAYKPILTKVLEDYDITIYHVDNSKLSTSEYAEFRTYINISGTPTIAFITNGEEETTLNRISGQTTRENTISKFKSNGYIK